ncbi:MAG: hypothetical protein JXB03_05175 [Spirochaetales bacterium]|nr:hypothetical protein [Spirochaetales bacterium]
MRNTDITIYKTRKAVCIGLSLFCILLVCGCDSPRKNYLERLLKLESADGSPVVPEERIRELKNEIRAVEEEVRTYVDLERELGTFYKMAAVDFFDGGNFRPALENFIKAMEIHGESPSLPYYAALCAAHLGKAAGQTPERQAYYIRAEEYYLHSIRISPGFEDSMYGLAVLYLYELNRPGDGFDYIQRYLEIRPSSVKGHFVRAAAYATAGRTEDAIDDYRWIVDNAKDPEEQIEARRNIEILMGGGA